MLPGMDGTGLLFEPLVTALGGHYQTRIVSYPNDSTLGYEALQDYARAALPERGSYVLLAESFSGPIAVRLAATQPPGLQALILCATFVRNPHPGLAWLAPLAQRLPAKRLPSWFVNKLLLGSFAQPALGAALKRAIDLVDAKVLRARLQAVLSIDATAALVQCTVPVLYLQASADRLVPAMALAPIRQHCRALSVCAVRGPHGLLQAAPQASAAAIRAFLEHT